MSVFNLGFSTAERCKHFPEQMTLLEDVRHLRAAEKTVCDEGLLSFSQKLFASICLKKLSEEPTILESSRKKISKTK